MNARPFPQTLSPDDYTRGELPRARRLYARCRQLPSFLLQRVVDVARHHTAESGFWRLEEYQLAELRAFVIKPTFPE